MNACHDLRAWKGQGKRMQKRKKKRRRSEKRKTEYIGNGEAAKVPQCQEVVCVNCVNRERHLVITSRDQAKTIYVRCGKKVWRL